MINLKEEHSKFVKLYSFSSGATSPTNIKLVDEMISHLDEELFKNPNSKFIDPCAGTGTFGVVLYDKLLKYHDSKWIFENMIFMVDTSRVNCDLLKKLGFVNVYNDDFLKINFDMKFDALVGNFPFERSTSKTHKIWVPFLKKSKTLANKICVINPTLLWEGGSDRISNTRNCVKTHTSYINFNINHHFKIGESVCYNIIDLDKESEKTIVTYEDGTNDSIDVSESIVSNQSKKVSIEIVDKIKNFKNGSVQLFSDYKNTDGHATPKFLKKYGIIQEKKEIKYPYEFIHSSAQIYYTNKKSNLGNGFKVILNYSSSFKNIIITNGVVGKQVEALLANTIDEATTIKKNLENKVFQYFIQKEKTGGFNTGIFHLPNIDYTKEYSNTELYEILDINNPIYIKEIENYVG